VKFSGVSLWALVQDGLAQMRGVTWRAVTSKSCLFDMPTLKTLALAMPTRQWYDVGAEAGWDEKDVVDLSLGKL